MRGLGTVINLAAVAAGSGVGYLLGERLPDRIRHTVMQGLGLATIAVALVGLEPLFDADLGLRRSVILIGSIIAGGVLGEVLGLEARLENVGNALRRRAGIRDEAVGGVPRSSFVEGFVVASTVFCVGPLTILGAVEDGLGISIRLLAIKSALDGVASVGFASVYGIGVLGSLATIAVYQGGLTAAAALIAPALTPEVLAQLSAVGSLLVLGIGLRLLDIAQVRVVSLLPAVVIGPAAAGLIDMWL